ncbi:DUF7935 family protein [Lutibacter flavus]|uniref:Uncharacterized protein n=1 Tax=Lutibacter flavus TaxID=691689 RepID=A0A238VKI0_9FLAO|nr:hypothetical protein [Lutibacter flavus]SNR34213.1 hypothetical protein SAMN04488111_0564 [Lutibacter flavus]
MEINRIIDLLSYTIPTIVTGFVAYYFFKNYTASEVRKLKITLLKENQKHSLPIRLQAYERMTLFLERMNPSNLLLRVTSINNDKDAYLQSLINTIEQEFEHNLSQQIYISDKCWNVIIASKNATMQIIKNTADDSIITNAQELREAILKRMLNTSPPSTTALSFIKNEVKSFM